ncbi:MAG: DUF1905 domain-containing protein [Phycisphaerae bacterium]
MPHNFSPHRKRSFAVSLWLFLTLPKEAGAKLPSRGMVSVKGSINGIAFQATLEPDGQKSHWLKMNTQKPAASYRYSFASKEGT